MADYTTVARVQALLPTDIRIDASTEPNYSQVGVWITGVTGALDVALVAGGDTAPTADAARLAQFDLIGAMEVAWMVLVAKNPVMENAEDHPYHQMFLALIAEVSGAAAVAAGATPVVHAPSSYTREADPDDPSDGLSAYIRKDYVF